MFKTRPTDLTGCAELIADAKTDARGSFVKTIHSQAFAELGLRSDFQEQYYTVSRRGVLRGLHFQIPPHEHAKLVYCTEGVVFDAVVDLRKGSPSFGRHVTFTLSSEAANSIYIPAGLAHGFLVVSEQATIVYNVTSVYEPDSDTGIQWNSVGIAWPSLNPLISARDAGFLPFAQFRSPFLYSQGSGSDLPT